MPVAAGDVASVGGRARPRRPLPPFPALFAIALGVACGPTGTSAATAVPAIQSLAPVAAIPTATHGPIVASTGPTPRPVTLQTYDVPKGSGPHDVAPAADGGVWYTAQLAGKLGWLDPKTGQVREIALGPGSAPHGVIVGPDGAPWITDGGQNAIVRVDPTTSEVHVFKLPGPNVNLNTAAFDHDGVLWFTGQSGYIGRLDPVVRSDQPAVPQVVAAPRGPGPYGMTAQTGGGGVYYASLAGNHIAQVVLTAGTGGAPSVSLTARPIDPPTPGQGARRVWSDSNGAIWVSEWNAGQVARFDPGRGAWREWHLPDAKAMAYAVYVDERDMVWLTDWGANALVRFDPVTETFTSFPFPLPNANVRQLHGRPGEVWGAMSGQDKLVVARI